MHLLIRNFDKFTEEFNYSPKNYTYNICRSKNLSLFIYLIYYLSYSSP